VSILETIIIDIISVGGAKWNTFSHSFELPFQQKWDRFSRSLEGVSVVTVVIVDVLKYRNNFIMKVI